MPYSTKPNKLLFASSDSHSILSFRSELISSILKSGCSIIICCPKDKYFPKLKEKFDGIDNLYFEPINFRNTKINPILDILSIVKIASIIFNHRVDSIFSFHIKPIIYCSIVGRLLGVRKIFSMITGLGYSFTTNAINPILKHFIQAMLLMAVRLNKLIFFQNKDDYEFLSSSCKLDHKSFFVAGSGVNTEKFPFHPQPKAISFLFVGRLLAHKGVREYVEAARVVKKKYPAVSFKIAGAFHPNPSSITKEELNQWVISGVIDYLGEVEDMMKAYRDASICVLPSYREGCPRALLESLSVGRPVITTDAAGCRDIVLDPIHYDCGYSKGKNGYLVPVKSSELLAVAMLELIENTDSINLMSKASRELAVNKFDVNKVNSVILKALFQR